MDRFQLRAAIAIAAFVAIGAGSAAVSSAQQNPASVLNCIDRADRETMLDDQEIQRLCLGSADEGPSICYEAASDRTTLSNTEGISLCRCATSDGPVTCFEGVRTETGSWIDPTITMCSEITSRRLQNDCKPIQAAL